MDDRHSPCLPGTQSGLGSTKQHYLVVGIKRVGMTGVGDVGLLVGRRSRKDFLMGSGRETEEELMESGTTGALLTCLSSPSDGHDEGPRDP